MKNTPHNRTKNILKIIGIALLLIGFTCMIVGFVDFFNAFTNMERPKLFWCLFIGLPLMGIGSGFSIFAFRREITTYTKQETLPVVEDTVSTLSNAINGQRCACGQMNEATSNFCSACGQPLKKTCPTCGKEISTHDVYCSGCGNKL